MFEQEEVQLTQEVLPSPLQFEMNGFLDSIELKLAIAVLEECGEKIAIMGANLPKVNARFSMRGIKERSLKPIEGIKNKYLEHDNEDDEFIFHKLKLSNELHKIEKVITILIDEMKSEGSHLSLLAFNFVQKKIQQEEEDLIKTHKALLKGGGAAYSSRQLKETLQHKLSELEKQIRSLKEQEDELNFKVGTIKEYAENYNKARVEQTNIKIELAEEELKKKFQLSLKAVEDEELAHAQTVKFLNRKIKLLQDSLEYWNRTYKSDMEDRNCMLAKLETQINDQRTAMNKLSTEFQRREKELGEYLIIRAERIRQQELEDLRNSAATKIQSWWRGCMVRWELGEYSSDIGKRRKRKPKKK